MYIYPINVSCPCARLPEQVFCVAVCGSVLQCVAVCGSVLQCVAVCCSVLQCVAVCVAVFVAALDYHACMCRVTHMCTRCV